MIKDLQNKIIYTSVDASQLPLNIRDYQCDLIIEENIETSQTRKYLKFRHKQNTQAPFKIALSSFKKPATLMHIYKMQNQKLSLKGKIQRIGESRVEKPKKQIKYKDIQDDEDQEYVQKKLIFDNQQSEQESDDDFQNSESSSVGIAPNQEGKIKARSAIIQILNKRQRVNSIKQLSGLLKKEHKIKIPENAVKQIALKVCITQKKSKGYSLRPQYVDQFNDERIEGRKKIKQSDY